MYSICLTRAQQDSWTVQNSFHISKRIIDHAGSPKDKETWAVVHTWTRLLLQSIWQYTPPKLLEECHMSPLCFLTINSSRILGYCPRLAISYIFLPHSGSPMWFEAEYLSIAKGSIKVLLHVPYFLLHSESWTASQRGNDISLISIEAANSLPEEIALTT